MPIGATTGWENIHATVSDVEYNFADQTTSLTFSSEALNILGDNVDLLKQRYYRTDNPPPEEQNTNSGFAPIAARVPRRAV